MERKEIGKVTHYFGKIQVAAIQLSGELMKGDKIAIEGSHTSLEQPVDSLEIDRQAIEKAESGQEIAIKVHDRVREKDTVYKIIE